MNRFCTKLLAFCLLVLLSAGALAADLPVYKWTDSQGVLHYSDTPPKDATSVTVMDLPELPPLDPEKVAAIRAWIASVNDKQQRQQAEDDLQRRERELAEQQAQLQASLAALQQYSVAAEPAPVYLSYAPPRYVVRRREPDRGDLRPMRLPQKQASSIPSWPFPYNLTASSFPEEGHKP
jgi:hypothetical protein